MPAFSSVPPALSSPPTAAVSAVSSFSQPPSQQPSFSSELPLSLSQYSQLSSALSQPAPTDAVSVSASSLPHPSLNHMVLALRGNVTTKPTPSTSPTTSGSLITSTGSPSAGPSSRKWLPGVIVGAVLVVVAAAALAFWFTFRRRRRQRYEQARQNDPNLTPDQFRRRSHMSEAALMAEAERERRNIIRKSLISRSSASLSYLGAAGELDPAAVDEPTPDEDSYRGVPLYQRQPVPRPPLQPQSPPEEKDIALHDNYNHPPYGYEYEGAPDANTPLMPAPLNVSMHSVPTAPAPVAGAGTGLRDDYKEWANNLRRHTSRVAERHPSALSEVAEESETDQAAPLVEDNGRPASPPIPPRSRLRPLSMTLDTLPDLPDTATTTTTSGVNRQDSFASATNGFMPRQVHADPRNVGQTQGPGSPTSLYSVDFSQVGVMGGNRRASSGRTANSAERLFGYRQPLLPGQVVEHRRLCSLPTTHSPLFRQLALALLEDKTDYCASDFARQQLTPEEANKSIEVVLDTIDKKRALTRASTKSKRAKRSKTTSPRSTKAISKTKTTPSPISKSRQTTLVGQTRKPLKELHNKPTSSGTQSTVVDSSSAKMDTAKREIFKENLDNIVMCPDCKEYPPNLVEEFSSGDMVCDSCGLVVGDRIIDSRSEWRTFANDDQGSDDPSRVGEGANSLTNDEGLRTQIDTRSAPNKLGTRLALANKKSQSDKLNSDLQEGYKSINTLVDVMQTSQIVAQTAMHIYKLAYEHGQLKGKPKEAVIAGCIFIACRQCNVPRTFREIYAITHVTKKEIGRVFKSLESFLSKIQEKNPQASAAQGVKDYKASSSTSAEELCTRYCSTLNFRNTPRMEKISKALARKTTGIPDLAGRSPLSVAAACIYFASMYLDDPRASKDIALIAGVSDGTIKTAYRFLYNQRTTLVEPEWNGNLDNLSSS